MGRNTESLSLAEALPREMARVRDEVLAAFLDLQSRRLPNVIVEPQIATIRLALDAATKAMAEGDVVAMLQWYEELKGWQA